MSERYLFRGKRVDNGEWVIGDYDVKNGCTAGGKFFEHKEPIHTITYLLKNKKGDSIHYMGYQVDSVTLGQCTGLKDRAGTLIFEGDIVSISGYDYDEPSNDWYGEIISYQFGFSVLNEEDDYNICLCEARGSYTTTYEIIGNIHDNGELLKGGEAE
jgi:uncharacterized phage protein (TIGR01671 family)